MYRDGLIQEGEKSNIRNVLTSNTFSILSNKGKAVIYQYVHVPF